MRISRPPARRFEPTARREKTNYKNQITNKSQISISNDQNIQRGCIVSLPKFLSAGNYAIWHKCRRVIRLEFWISVIVICLVFVVWYLNFFSCWNLNPAVKHLQFLTTCCQIKPDKGLKPIKTLRPFIGAADPGWSRVFYWGNSTRWKPSASS